MDPNPRIALVERFFAAQRRGRPLTMLRLTTPDMTLRLPGPTRRLGPGVYEGRLHAALGMARIMWLTRLGLRVRPLSVEDRGDHVVVEGDATLRRGERRARSRITFRVTVRDGRIAAITESIADPGELRRWQDLWDGPA